MHNGFKLQEVHPVLTGSNPLWLEQRDKAAKIRRYSALFLLILIIMGAYYVAVDYLSAPDPNASECKMGFVETGCSQGQKCVGQLVPCAGSNTSYKYSVTRMIFPPKECAAAKIYKEICVPA